MPEKDKEINGREKSMTVHELKIRNEYWEEIKLGNKTFEIRKDDRGYRVGDHIRFSVILSPIHGAIDHSEYEITYILRNCPQYGLMDGYCILGIKELKDGR